MALRKQMLVSSVNLSQEPFYPVSYNSTADLPACGNTDAGMGAVVWGSKDDQVFGDQTRNLVLFSPFEINPFPQPLYPGECLV
jgi:hypothetical protein